jgi:hypothetical protein
MIEIDYGHKQKIYCPTCGTLTLSFGESGQEFEMNKCPHLEWLGTDEGPEFDRNKLYVVDYDDDTHFLEHFRKTLDDHYVCFTQRTPPPGMLSGYVIFKFPLD